VLVVADSSPLIYLSRIGLLHILPTLFGDLVVPRAVWNEAVGRRPSAPGIESLRPASWMRVVDDPSPLPDLGLDPGETAAILLAESLHADLLLIDERPGREVAQEVVRVAVAGRQGFEFRARRLSKFVMARDFWF
jgi:predicted nucleic acid-binding protein